MNNMVVGVNVLDWDRNRGFMESAAFPAIPPEDLWLVLATKAQFKSKPFAKVCGVSLRTMQRYFKGRGLKLGQWLKEVRLTEALRRLNSGMGIKEVSFECGYGHVSNFSRDFKKRFGVSPGMIGQRERAKSLSNPLYMVPMQSSHQN